MPCLSRVAALTSRGLTTARSGLSGCTALRAVVEHRDDLVKTRTQTGQPSPCRVDPSRPLLERLRGLSAKRAAGPAAHGSAP